MKPTKINEVAFSNIVHNLIQNALEAIQEFGGSSIEVTLRRKRGYHRIETEDDGGGVSEDIVPHLFTKFATQKTGGMGFGLHYCKVLTGLHNGKISYKETKNGSLFIVDLPKV